MISFLVLSFQRNEPKTKYYRDYVIEKLEKLDLSCRD